MRVARRTASAIATAIALASLAVLLAACGGTSDAPAPAPSASAAALEEGLTAVPVPPRGILDGPYPRFHDAQLDLSITLGTPDIGPGRQRVSFVLSDASGLVRLPVVQGAVRLLGAPEGPPASMPFVARFAPFPDGIRGLYATSVEFAHAGRWAVELSLPRPDGTVVPVAFPLTVHETTRAPMVGAPAPPSRTKTAADAPSLLDLSTGASPDPALYERSIATALEEGRPFVVVFASPGFCTNALCGPQVEQLTELRADYAERAAFLHVELYENPQEVRARGLDAGRRVAAFEEWGLTSDEWTFVVDGDGRIAARFEGFAPREEVEAALRAVLAG